MFDINKPYKPKMFLDPQGKAVSIFADAQAVIVPFGYEGTVTFGHGTDKGPEALIESSYQVEPFDDELLDDVYDRIKIFTTTEPKIEKDPLKACKQLKEVINEVIDNNKFPVAIGGEHTISYGFAQALNDKYKDVTVLVFDAHMDLGDRSSGKDFTHAAWLRYSLNLPNIKQATLVGIRNFNKLEYEFWQDNKNRIKVFPAKDKDNWNHRDVLKTLGENVYLSFDIDAFDASLMPSTGTPEPGGLFWDETLSIIREVAKTKNIIGMDLVELAPIKNMHGPNFLAAKLLMKMILYKFLAKTL